MNQLADLKLEEDDGVVVATIQGEVDSSNVSELHSRILDALTNDSTALVVDLLSASYLDSAALSMLFQLGGDLRARRQQLRIVADPHSGVARTMSITGIGALARIHGSRREALA